ncbi:MAG: LysR family transcriptional regulator [Lautropia sp.]
MSASIDLESLEVFAQVAAMGSLTVAATRLGLTQSAVSKRIAGLESSLGGRLFARTGRGVRLTSFGQEALPRADGLLREAAGLLAMGKARSHVPTGEVRIGIAPPKYREIVLRLYDAVSRQYPEVRLTVSSAFTSVMTDLLMRGELDLAILNRFVRGATAGDTLLGVYDTYLLGPPDSEFVAQPEIRFAQLAGIPLVLPSAANEMRKAAEAAAARAGIKLNVIVSVDSLPVILDLVATGRCHTLLMVQTAREQLEAGAVRASLITRPALKRRLVLCASAFNPPSLAVRRIGTLLRRIVPEILA